MNRISEIFLTNIKYKVTVLLLAISVWFFVKIEDNYKYTCGIPLRITNLGKTRIVVNEIPKKVQVTFWGKGRSLLSLMIRKDASYIMDVSRKDNKKELILDKNNVKLLKKNNIEVLNIAQPNKIEVVIKDVVEKKVAVESRVQLETKAGYTVVGKQELNPDSVLIRGPETTVDSIFNVYTANKTIKEIKRDIIRKVRLIPPKHNHVTIDQHHVEIFIHVQKLMERPLSEIPVEVVNKPKGYEVTVVPSTLSLILEGGTGVLLNVTQKDVKAYIDYEKIKTSHEKYHPAYIDTPDDVRYRNVNPTRFKLLIERKN